MTLQLYRREGDQMKVLVTPTSLRPDKPSPALEKLQAFANDIIYNPYGRPLTQEELIELLPGCDGYIAGLDYVDASVIAACDKLRVISRYGAGVDRVDLAAAKEKGITVCNTPGANAQAVADLTLGLILAVARKIPVLDADVRAGGWRRSTGVELYGKTIGILGLGAIGKAVAKRAQGFSMKVLAYDPYMDQAYAAEHDITSTTIDQIVREADVICLHLPYMPETRHIISGELMSKMKKGVIIINTSRGGLIDEDAAAVLLESGHLGGLGLDAFEVEPVGETPLSAFDNVVLTPHTAAHTHEATANMANMAVQNLIDVLSGQECPYVIR